MRKTLLHSSNEVAVIYKKFVLTASIVLILLGCQNQKKKSSESASLHLQLGNSYYNRQNYPRALSEFLLARELMPDEAVVRNNLGLAYFMQKKYQLAKIELLQAIKINEAYTDARINLARVVIELEQFTEATEQLEKAKNDLTFSEPDKVWQTLGAMEFKRGDFVKAKTHAIAALKINRFSCAGYTLYARSFYELKDFTSAAGAFEKSIDICKQGSFDEPYYFSALNLIRLGDRTRGKSRLEEYLERSPFGEYSELARQALKNL
jgi:type IV pilus assembly protein PilF